MTMRSTLWLSAALTVASALAACLDDSEDGKASAYTVVMLDSGLPDAAAGDAGTVRLELGCPGAVVTEHTLAGFSARLFRAGDGAPVPGAFVALSPSTGIVVAPEAGGGTTDATGSVAFAFAAPHFDASTPISLEASTRGADGKVIASARCSFQIVTAGLVFSSPEATPVTHGIPLPLSLRVQARDVVPRCSDGGGVRAAFVDPARGGVSAGPTEPPSPSACVDVMGAGDVATFYVHPGERGGPAQLEATAASYRQALTLQVTGAPASISLRSDAIDLAPDSAANLTAKVVDDAAQPVRGATLALELTRCATTPCAAGEQLSVATVVTQPDGTAGFVYFAGSAAGTAQITASVIGRPAVVSGIALRVK